MDDVNDFLAHYGKKGMKWGVTTADSASSGGGDSASRKKLSRKEVREANKAGEREFNEKKLANVYSEAKSKGEQVLIKSRASGDFADTVMTGKQFVEHVERGGLIDARSTAVFARQSKAGEQFVLNADMDQQFQKIKR